MSRSTPSPIQLFRSGPSPCPYLDGRTERKLVVFLGGPQTFALNSQLTRAGFRRSQDIAYRPDCQNCTACIPVRLAADRLHLDRTQRRILRANRDLTIASVPAVATMEQYALFSQYQSARHADSDMARMSFGDYADMVETGVEGSEILESRDGDGRLRGALLLDRLADGASAVYSFFDPDVPRRSLGTFLVLALAGIVREQGGRYVYLGYWIEECAKMAYKTRFRPVERLTAEGWRLHGSDDGA